MSNTSTLIYKDGESEVYKKLEYDDTQRLYFCFTTAAITDINVNDEMQKYTIAFNQVGKEATYDMYINGKQVIIISRDDDVKKIVSSEELNLEIIYLISQPIKFDEGLEFINIENTYIMPDMYLNGKKINGGFFPSGTYSLLRSVEDILKNEEGFVVKKNEELKISSNSNKIFPDYTLGVIFNDSLNKEVKVTRKSDGSFYFNAPDEVGEYLFYFDVYFFKDKKAGSYYFKLIVE